ncbi:MAG TPA: class I SAM-dependent methyltransferase [Anaeromyxobacteraceae bacterium]|nr:class I SAM-dependent methyltransferase [Anaeromyxobacteraceae bacterium]
MPKNATAERRPPANYYAQARPELVAVVNPAGLRVLEVGCATGVMGAALLEKGAREVVGLDVFEPALAEARSRLTAVHRVDLNALPALPYPEGHFDLVTCADVLEHLVDPAAVLRHLRRWLADDGRVLVSIPNVRHESVVLPLLVDGDFTYRDAGILDRTHLRFFTRSGVLALLADAGLALEGTMAGTQTPRPPWTERAADLVEALGGDRKKFLDECDVVQFVFFATPTDRRANRLAPVRPDPWAGSRPVRILIAPSSDPADRLDAAFPRLARACSGAPDVTIGIALPPGTTEPPAALACVEETVELDVLLLERPSAPAGWDALLDGVKLVVLTSDVPELAEAARRRGLDVRDARTDPELGAPPRDTAP